MPSRSNTCALVREVDRRELDAPRAAMYCQMSSSVQLDSGNTRMCSPRVDAGRCRGSTARAAGSSGPTGRTRRGRRTPAPWRGPSPRRGGRRRTRRRTGARSIASSSVGGLQPVAAGPPAGLLGDPARVDRVLHRGRPPAGRRARSTRRSRNSSTSGKLCPVSTCITGNGIRAGQNAFSASAQHDDRVLAAGEQQHRPLELGGHLPDDVDRLGLQHVELGQLSSQNASRPSGGLRVVGHGQAGAGRASSPTRSRHAARRRSRSATGPRAPPDRSGYPACQGAGLL